VWLCVGSLAAAGVMAPRPAAQSPSVAPTYRLEPVRAATIQRRFTPDQIGILEKLNRRDLEHLVRLDEMIVPDEWRADELDSSPLPRAWPAAEATAKVLVVHQPAQVFGAYASGRLVRWGPVSSGRKETPTPTGLFHLNWRSKSRVSTENEQWLLKWYFNFINERGVSFHEFEMPGYPASHACVRLLARDAMWLYDWGEEWVLSRNGREVVQFGTPLLILDSYDYAQPPPWRSPEWWRTPLTLPSVMSSGLRDPMSFNRSIDGSIQKSR
jgi:hypothetical protein